MKSKTARVLPFAFFSLVVSAVVLNFLFQMPKASPQTEMESSATGGNGTGFEVTKKTDGCAEINFSNYLAMPGNGNRYDCRTPIDVKINDKDIIYYTVSAERGFLTTIDWNDQKQIKVYANSEEYPAYSLCKSGDCTPFESDTVLFRFYNSDRQQVYSYNISVSGDGTGQYFLSRASHTIADQ